MIIKLRKIMRC